MEWVQIQKRCYRLLRDFSKDRDWDQYHSPKNLAMALSVEVAELVEIFQWSNEGGLDVIKDQKQKEKRFTVLYIVVVVLKPR